MAEGRGGSLGLLFHSLTKRENILVTAEAWFPSERGNIYTCRAMCQLLGLFAAVLNWNNLHRLHGSLSDFELGTGAVSQGQEAGGKERITSAQRLSIELTELSLCPCCLLPCFLPAVHRSFERE